LPDIYALALHPAALGLGHIAISDKSLQLVHACHIVICMQIKNIWLGVKKAGARPIRSGNLNMARRFDMKLRPKV